MSSEAFNISRFKQQGSISDQYERQLRRLIDDGKEVDCVERAVRGALKNLSGEGRRSFVIYGEPQSGKTEMMICLTAKLLDNGSRFILHLLNDSVDLLGQNLGRFQDSGLAPSARNYTDIRDPEIDIRRGRYVVFAKKNARDLQKLLDKINGLNDIVIIDDEADFASPNSKINKDEKTKINALISELLGYSGDYIGVTATPARLDLNNTFDNDSQLWVKFPPHKFYSGQDVFFPDDIKSTSDDREFQLSLLQEKGDDPKYLRRAIFSYLVNLAYLNMHVNGYEENYSMLIHTSGKKVDHKTDWSQVHKCLDVLSNDAHRKFESYIGEIWHIAKERYADVDTNDIVYYVVKNITRNAIITLNSDRDFKQNGVSATRPSSLITIIIGGNIVSRGVTFENLLSMFFTRDVKHKIQQDTYIQRARMFGSRGKYLKFFELTIPEGLYLDWHRCFMFHRLALESIDEGMGSPVWLSDKRIAAVAGSSIDRSTVDLDRGEMAFRIFDYKPVLDSITKDVISNSAKLDLLSEELGEEMFPSYLRKFITRMSSSLERELAIHSSSSIAGYSDDDPGLDKLAIERRKGFFGAPQMEKSKFPHAIHHLKVFTNDEGKGRLFYKFSGSIKFIRNSK